MGIINHLVRSPPSPLDSTLLLWPCLPSEHVHFRHFDCVYECKSVHVLNHQRRGELHINKCQTRITTNFSQWLLNPTSSIPILCGDGGGTHSLYSSPSWLPGTRNWQFTLSQCANSGPGAFVRSFGVDSVLEKRNGPAQFCKGTE